jgi:hypothetical protein
MPNADVSQVSREALLKQAPNARVSEVAREALLKQAPNARVSQVAREALLKQAPNARASMVARQTLIPIYFSTTFRILPIMTAMARRVRRRQKRIGRQIRPLGTVVSYQPFCFVTT